MPICDVKGNRISYSSSPDVSQGAIERQMFEIERGPRMLPRRVRARAWFGLGVFFIYFLSCFYLTKYRLRSDDLELMEREVYEELKTKKEVDRFLSKSRQEEKLRLTLSDKLPEVSRDYTKKS